MNKNLFKKLSIIGGLSFASLLAGSYLIAPQEGLELYPYYDSVGVLTVCRGHTGSDIQMRSYTEEECNKIYVEDLHKTEKQLDTLVKVPLNDYQKASLISFAFNVGINNVKTSTLLKKFNEGQYVEACRQLSRWVYAGKKDCRIKSSNCSGIVTRRQVEMDWCLGKYKLVNGELVKTNGELIENTNQ